MTPKERMFVVFCALIGWLLGGCYVQTGIGVDVTPIVPAVVVREHVHTHHYVPQDNYNNFCYVCAQYRRGQHLRHR